jgi:anti-anti-sigma factor
VTSVHRHPGHPFAASVERDGAAATLRLSGEFDVACEDSFKQAVAEALSDGTHELLVDLRDLAFIDSSGLRFLIAVWMESRRDGFDLSVLQGTGHVRRVLDIAGLERVLPIADAGSSKQSDA